MLVLLDVFFIGQALDYVAHRKNIVRWSDILDTFDFKEGGFVLLENFLEFLSSC